MLFESKIFGMYKVKWKPTLGPYAYVYVYKKSYIGYKKVFRGSITLTSNLRNLSKSNKVSLYKTTVKSYEDILNSPEFYRPYIGEKLYLESDLIAYEKAIKISNKHKANLILDLMKDSDTAAFACSEFKDFQKITGIDIPRYQDKKSMANVK